MVYQLGTGRQAAHGLDVTAIRLYKLHAFGDVAQVAADEIVAAHHIVSLTDKGFCKMASQETCDARYQDLHRFQSDP